MKTEIDGVFEKSEELVEGVFKNLPELPVGYGFTQSRLRGRVLGLVDSLLMESEQLKEDLASTKAKLREYEK